jgi:DNA-directed RNA polymerase subunit L
MLTDYRLRVSELKGTAKLLSLVHSAKIPNCSTYKFQLEDHTLGNLMRAYLMKQSEIKYSGYKNIHPLKEQLELKIQTKN